MPTFNPNVPQALEDLDAGPIRDNFNAVHEEATAPETDPVFAASEAAQFVPGDKAKLDAALVTETDPVFAASEAALLVPGDKARLDAALTSPLTGALLCDEQDIINAGHVGVKNSVNNSATNTPVLNTALHALCNAAGQPIVGFRGYIPGVDDPGAQLNDGAGQGFLNPQLRTLIGSDGLTVAATWADGILKDGSGTSFQTGAYSPANPGHWAGSPPATVAEALDRLAAVVSNAGANPIP
ncbi:MAG: hypothetical protein PCFJNLEI_01921 [Verrucomicrobiae bacterium]|nr:hypothetical protein [Verrucomicrobiae bacterium]